MHTVRQRPRRPFNYLLLLLLLVTSFAWAHQHDGDQECTPNPNNPNCTPDGQILVKWKKPTANLQWRLTDRATFWSSFWRSWEDNSKNWFVETYRPSYVHPYQFTGDFFNQCQTQNDWDYWVNGFDWLKSQTSRYQWSVDGQIKVADGDCFEETLILGDQGIHDVKLEVFNRDSDTPYLTKTEDVRVRDFLIVLLGDSAASARARLSNHATRMQPGVPGSINAVIAQPKQACRWPSKRWRKLIPIQP